MSVAADPLGVGGIPACGSCKRAILWATMPTGALMPVDYPPLEREPAARDVVRNPRTGGGITVSRHNLDLVPKWLAHGATLHTSHWATCPNAKKHRRRA